MQNETKTLLECSQKTSSMLRSHMECTVKKGSLVGTANQILSEWFGVWMLSGQMASPMSVRRSRAGSAPRTAPAPWPTCLCPPPCSPPTGCLRWPSAAGRPASDGRTLLMNQNLMNRWFTGLSDGEKTHAVDWHKMCCCTEINHLSYSTIRC